MHLAGSIAIAILFVAAQATAQDISEAHRHNGYRNDDHAENHDWYRKLTQPGTTYSCCNGDAHGGDCRPTRAYVDDGGQWHAQMDGRWVTVPSRAVIDRLAPDGNSHICASKGGYIFCFIGGSPKS
jgi:hypothetical protein